MLNRLTRGAVVALTLAMSLTAAVLATDGTTEELPAPESGWPPEAALIDPGFVVIVEDESNDRAFVVIVDDPTNDAGFLVPEGAPEPPVTPEPDLPASPEPAPLPELIGRASPL